MQRTQDREALARGQQGDGNNGEIKDIPGALEKCQPIDGNFHHQFDNKDRNGDLIKRM